MNIENITKLADIINAKGLSAIEVGDGENRIRIEKGTSAVSAQPTAVSSQVQADVAATTVSNSMQDTTDTSHHHLDINNLIEIKSPLVGVYYAAPSPDAETFVSIGSRVKKGDVLCIIETMKLMNEITSEHDGEIVDICIKNGDIAEFGQVLFKIVG